MFEEEAFASLDSALPSNAHFIIDAKVAGLYGNELAGVLATPSVLCVEAIESNKSIDKFTGYVEHLVSNDVRRGDTLIAIGGGIIQDIVSFLGATLLRGLRWHFYPTTLLAQADSCIGSKSSINVGHVKNVLGTFTPPERIVISSKVLDTLDERDLRSGMGEMLKVHAIEGPESFDRIATDYTTILTDRKMMMHYIRRSLDIKKTIVEQDEFDRGIRNVMNYGHSFGHAIESATGFGVPHGIAVTIGMDMANFTAVRLGLLSRRHYERMHPTLAMNFAGFEKLEIPMGPFFVALGKDKKNTNSGLNLILPDASARPARGTYTNDAAFRAICAAYLSTERCR
jgi:3-dehydroquinate synthase